MTVHPFIEAEKRAGHSVKRACELLKVSRTAFYARRAAKPGPRAVRDAELAEQIADVHTRSRGTYGAPRVHAVLKRAGAGCGRRRVARLMRAAGLQGRHRRRRHLTTIPDPRVALRPDLVVRDFQPDPAGLDARWCGDITYIATEEGWLYLATVIDIASRRVVGWATADHLRTDLVADALTAACRKRRPTRPVIFHSDRGCQYTSQQFAALADQLGVRLSVGRTGQCWDNALAESFFATVKGSCSTPSPGPAGPPPAPRSLISSRAGTTCTVCTAASAIAVPPNTRPHSQPDHHTDGVRQSGTSSERSVSLFSLAPIG
ncbi:IS3 family transposase [Streptomyces sp. NBC_00289]